MSRIYSNSYFHYTKKMEYLIGILENGFRGSYCREDFKTNAQGVFSLYIPMVSFCDIPLSKVSYVTYGKYGIGMSSSWGNDKALTPVCYFPNNSNSLLTKFISNIANDSFTKAHQGSNKCPSILAYSKPRKKYKKDGHRSDNYIERECRKAYTEFFVNLEKPKMKHPKMLLTFVTNNVDFIIVPNENERKNLIGYIMKFKTIGGNKVINNQDRLTLISKITTLEEITKNY